MAFDRSRFIGKYKAEARERLEKLSLGLVRLETNPSDTVLLEAMMREAHSIKGSSTMMGYKRVAEIAHKMESCLESARKGEVALKKRHYDVLLKCVDSMQPLLEDKIIWEDRGVENPYVYNLCREVDLVFGSKEEQKKEPEQKPVKMTCDIADNISIEDSVRVETARLDNMVNLAGELVISRIRLDEISRRMSEWLGPDTPSSISVLIKDLERIDASIITLSNAMHEEVMGIRMLPVSGLFNVFPRAMRELAFENGKEVNFTIAGGETRLDKVIIDQLKDPIMHILRNSVDHGIELPTQRSSAGKERLGNISLSAYREGSQIVIKISDDGAGMDKQAIKDQAVKKGFLSQGEADKLSEQEIQNIVFISGFSTKDDVSTTSGRGVGLDVVRDIICRLKGAVEVDSSPGHGTCFVMRVPVTLAITGCLLVSAGSEVFALPIDSVKETIRTQGDDVRSVEGKDAVAVNGSIIPLVKLSDIFGVPKKGIFEKKYFPVIIVQSVEKKMGIMVDNVLGRHEIIIKSIGDPLKHVKNIQGATVLGSGKVVLVLDIPSIIDSSDSVTVKKLPSRSKTSVKSSSSVERNKRKTILLAEDVLSTAMLEKSILESAGYSVVLARDGKDALIKMSQEKFDLLITDVLMPRMDGFELTEALKRDRLYSDIPIIIVTTRENDQDKRRGLTAGADAYILKSEFTSDTLLETIGRLIG